MSSDSKPLVSIVIPVYNGANYLADAIDSALAQTYPHKEVIVVNDGSSDNGATRDVADRYGSRIRCVDKPNGGVASALNAGIAAMRGELFSWLSHDDIYRPEKIARQVETWQGFGQQSCVVLGDYEMFSEETGSVTKVVLDGYNVVARPLDTVFYGLINGCTLLIPRSLFNQAGLFEVDLPTTQDYYLWYRMASIVPFVRCPHIDVRQRMHPLQGSRQAAHLDEAGRMFSYLLDNTPVRTMEAYEGSELRFLLKIRRALYPYASLRRDLTRRINELLADVSYSVAIFTETDRSLASEIEALQRLRHPPSRILAVQVEDSAARSAKHPPSPPEADGLVSFLTTKDTCPGDIVRTVRQASCGPVLFLNACNREPSAEESSMAEDTVAGPSIIPDALQALLRDDGDVGRPAGSQQILSELHGLAVRQDALGKLADLLDAPYFNWELASTKLRIVTYAAPDARAADLAETVTEALKGKTTVHFHRGLSETGIAGAIRGLLTSGLPTILFLQHTAGGGAQTHLQSLMRALKGKANCIVAYGTSEAFYLGVNAEEPENGVVFSMPKHRQDLVRILRRIGITQIDVHHVMGFEAHAELLLEGIGIPYDVTLVDYHMVANNPFLCFTTGEFVGDTRLRNLEYNLLRRGVLPVLRNAARVIAISRDLAVRIKYLSPGLPVTAVRLWHEHGVQLRHVFVPKIRNNEPLRVLIAGSIGLHKGKTDVIDVARQIAIRNLPIRLHLLGTMEVPDDVTNVIGSVLTLHGRYEKGAFVETASGIGPHVAWLPSHAPETWSYVLTEYMNMCLPVAARAVGSMPERCYGRPATWLLPWDAKVNDWVDLFLRLHASRLQEPPRWAPVDQLPPLEDFYFEQYLQPSFAGS